MACDPVGGDLFWSRDLVRDFGVEVPGWHAGQCPLMDGDRVILAPAGSNVLMVAYHARTGRVLWKCAPPAPIKMSHSSIAIATVGDQRMYVYAGIGGVVGVGASGARDGQVLWLSTDWTPSVIAPSPVPMDDGLIFLTAGYGAGSALLKVEQTGGDYSVRTLYKKNPRDGLACEQMTAIFYRGQLFGIMPKDGGAMRNQFACFTPDGTAVWSSGKTVRFGIGPYVLADGKFYILDDDGALTMARWSSTAYEPLGHAQVLDGHDSWGPLTIVDGRLLARDSLRMVCLDISRDGVTAPAR
jgi:outer membrane protein assembly factor BamB